jgi:sec-independent protein translocase protein TatA
MFADLSLGHILIIMLIVMLVFGSKRLPEMGASMGKGIREFKRSLKEVQDTIDTPEPATPVVRRLETPVLDDREPKKLSE